MAKHLVVSMANTWWLVGFFLVSPKFKDIHTEYYITMDHCGVALNIVSQTLLIFCELKYEVIDY